MSLSGNVWNVLKKREVGESLFDSLLSTRGEVLIANPAEMLHDPFLMHDMEKGCERIERAIRDKERIVVFGDYDVDGVTATTVLVRTLTKLGAEVSYRIPHRILDGYSLKNYHIDELKAANVKVIITVDNGISAAREIAYADGFDMDIVVTDHHTPPAVKDLPKAYAIINPKMDNCAYPYKELSGSAVAMKLCLALYKRAYGHMDISDPFVAKLYQVAGIGIVADCMQITGENKAIVQIALESLNKEPLRGIGALLKKAGIDGRLVTAQDIAFYLAPRLNAAGRLDTAGHALQIFLNQSSKVTELATLLHNMNAERKSMTEEFFEEALLQLAEQEIPKVIIVSSENWNSGINGLVGSRLVGRYSRPAIVMSLKEGMFVGSCRSIDGFNMVEALRSVEDILVHFGGHHSAAGFAMKEENFYEFHLRIQQYAEIMLLDHDFVKRLRVDTEIFSEELTMNTLTRVGALAPFGMGNPVPVFLLEGANISNWKVVGQDGMHLACEVNGVRAIAFGAGKMLPKLGGRMDVLVSLDINVWKEKEYLQLQVLDFGVYSQKIIQKENKKNYVKNSN